MTEVTLRNATDTYVDAGQPTRTFSTLSAFHIREGAPYRRAFLYFALNIPRGATVHSARLILTGLRAVSGTQELRVHRAAQKFDPRTVKWGTQPTVTGTAATSTKTSPPALWKWDINVQPQIQAVADGAAWYGFRVVNNAAVSMSFFAAQSPYTEHRPMLVVEWSDAPQEPDFLSPGGGRAISVEKPIVRTNFVDASGDTSMQAIQVQVNDTEDFTAPPDWDSTAVPVSGPELDLSTALGTLAAGTTGQPLPAVPANAERWWRTRVQDGAGLWSAWSSPTNWVRKLKGTVTLVNPPGSTISDPSPPIAWTFGGNGRTQVSYEVIVRDPAAPAVNLWTSGKLTSDDTAHTIPVGTIKVVGKVYRIIVRVWDEQDRENIPLDPPYVQVSTDVTYEQSATVAPLDNLSVASLSPLPGIRFTGSRADGDPDSFALVRDGEVVRTYDPEEVRTSPGNYAFEDLSATARKDHTWYVACIVNDVQSSGNPSHTGRIHMAGPWLMEPDGTNAIGFLNPERSGERWDGSEVFQPVGEGVAPVMVSQGVGADSGEFSGVLADEAGVPAEEMLARFKALRRKQGTRLHLHYINEVLAVFVKDMNYAAIANPDGTVDYLVRFRYWEIP